mmetsp:Transcript_105267/g.250584  ORF Transcript_105267/g.250584 Transcript_105267/m.250584 type:complete len:81 (+) Transcript_105267:72-314(+)
MVADGNRPGYSTKVLPPPIVVFSHARQECLHSLVVFADFGGMQLLGEGGVIPVHGCNLAEWMLTMPATRSLELSPMRCSM